MDAREKDLIKTIARRLDFAAKPPFKTGDLPQWSKWANSMQAAIGASTDILDSLTKTVEEPKKESEEDFIAKNLKE